MRAKLLSAVVTILITATLVHASEQLRWTPLSGLDRATRSWVTLDEAESIRDIQVAQATIRQNQTERRDDALFVRHRNSYFCGSGGCLLEVLVRSNGGGMTKVLEVWTDEVSLGRDYTNGTRNLRLNDAVTWVWNGREYVLK